MNTMSFNNKRIRFCNSEGSVYLVVRDLCKALGYSDVKNMVSTVKQMDPDSVKEGIACLNIKGIDSMIARAAKAPNHRKLDSWLSFKSALPGLLGRNADMRHPDLMETTYLDSFQKIQDYIQRLEAENKKLRTENEQLSRVKSEIKRFFSALA